MPSQSPPSDSQRAGLLNSYRAALARALAKEAEQTERASRFRSRLDTETERLRRTRAAIAKLEGAIRWLEGEERVTPNTNYRRRTPLPVGAVAEIARDIFRESDGRWLEAEEIARSALALYEVCKPTDDMVEAATDSASAVLRRLVRDGLAEHDGGQRPRRWRRIADLTDG